MESIWMMGVNILEHVNHFSKDGLSIIPPANSANNAKEEANIENSGFY